MTNYEPSLEILEVEYSCSPGGIDLFEVYDKTDIPLSVPIYETCLLYTSPSPRDRQKSRMPSSA